MSRRLVAVLALAVLAARVPAADPLERIDFGIISTESSANLKSAWEPFLADLEQAIGMPVKPFFASDYAGVIEAMRFGKIQMAWYGNKSAMEAVDRADAEIFCHIVDKDGNPGYWSLIVTRQDSPLQSLDELLAKAKDLSFAMGDPNSTSGTLIPGYYVFAKHQMDPQKAFKRCISGNHEANALAVVAKQVDAATFNTEAMYRLEQTAPDKAKVLRVLWKSQMIPADPIAWRKDLAPDMKAKIKAFFLGYGKTDAQLAKIKPLNWSRFEESNDDQLLPIRQVSIAKERAKVEADEHLGADEKAAKLKELDAKLAELDAKAKVAAK